AGLDLISLDSKYTNEYNYNNDESGEFHLCSFRGIDYLPRGCRLVAKTPHILYNKIKDYFCSVIIQEATGELTPSKRGARLIHLDNNYTKKYNYSDELCPHQSRAKLVSLDNNHTNKYNYEHNMVHSMLLMGHK
ncbi:hypothetical protein CFT13S00388_09710, partial [Campylobacter fetus subsp. testudinum]